MPSSRVPYWQSPLVDSHTGQITREWWRFQEALSQQTEFAAFEVTVAQGDVASAGQKILIRGAAGEQWKIRGIVLSSDGTNFSGGGGDRDLAITDGTTTWSVIPATTLQTLAVSRWGVDAGMPNPATASHLFAASASNTNIVAQYSGGATDYSAGSCTIMLLAERVA